MASKNGPYTATIVTKPNGFEENTVSDAQGNLVLDFTNEKKSTLYLYTTQEANDTAAALSNDDTTYLALVESHYFHGGLTIKNGGQNALIAEAVLTLEGASFASDPAAVSALATLARALLL